MSTKLVTFVAATFAMATFGCSTTVRSLSATAWIAPPGGVATPAAAPAAASATEGQPAAAAAPAPAAGGIASHYYVTYWEGSCKAILGCSRGDSHVKRCKVNPDNSLTCTPEAVATKALTPN